jgi:hypothetical protein
VKKIKIKFTPWRPMTLDEQCSFYTFQCVFTGLITIAYGVGFLMRPGQAGDQAQMIGLGLWTVVLLAYRVQLGAKRDREREAKEKGEQ